MADTIKCPYLMPSALSAHEFDPKTKIENGYIIHYCGKCKNTVFAESKQISQILNALSGRLRINE
jgi:hypothetical protein